MKNLIIVISIIFPLQIFACQCKPESLFNEIANSQNIFIGKVLDINDNNYEIDIYLTYKGNIDVNKNHLLTQSKDGCHKNKFFKNQIYVFFETENGCHQCSRTIKLENSKAITTLEKIYPDSIIDISKKDELKKLIRDNKYNLKLANGGIIDTENKKVIYFDGKLLTEKKNQIENHWNSTHFSLLDENLKIDGKKYDYIIYFKKSHQNYILDDKNRLKLKNKMIRKYYR